jgi:DNA-binding SARP family transcriptional activator/tetratricopeptide (TPR) repeat protein
MQFSVLGRLAVVSDDGTELPIRQPRQRALLAVLLLHANHEVSAGRLTGLMGDEDEPEVSPGALRTQVWALRKLLAPTTRLHTGEHRGYQLEVRPGELDLARFRELAGQGRRAFASGDLRVAADSLSEGLALWGQPPLADVPATLAMGAIVQRLLEERAAARDLLTEARLGLGQHAGLIPELREGTTADPTNERLWEQLMRALHGADRTADALAAYQQARTALTTNLGMEPGQGLQQLHRRILAGDREPASTGASPGGPSQEIVPAARREQVVPRQLPAPVRPFAGRNPELAELDGLLESADAPAAVVISAIGGTAGVGKTALAVHWAHQVADRFPDGQLYVNLHGFGPTGKPSSTAAAIRIMLDALEVAPQRIPDSQDAQAGLYRSLMAGKRMLLVLDNARDAEQVRPLLPGSPGCLVVVTSRSQLAGLAAVDGARSLILDVLPHDEAVQLLADRIGAVRDAETGSLDQIAALCAHLPLALAVAAARAAARPSFPLTELVAELRGAAGRLDALDAGAPAVNLRAVFSWSYQQLSPDAARMFRLLGLHPGPDISVSATASLGAVDEPEARRLLREVARACLLTEHAPGRYSFHDLLRAYAADQARECDSQSDRDAAIGRILDHYLHTAAHAARMLRPDWQPILAGPPSPGTRPERPSDHRQALAWFEAEHQVLLAAVAFAADTGADSHAWQLPSAMTIYLYRRSYSHERITVMGTALTAATRLDDTLGQAVSLRGLGSAYASTGDYDQARAHLERCLSLYQRLGDRSGEAWTEQNLALLAERQGRYSDGLAHAERTLWLYQATGHEAGQAEALNSAGWFHALLGDYQRARAVCEQSLAIIARLDRCFVEYHAWDTLGYIELHLGNPAQAAANFEFALGLCRDYGDRFDEAQILTHAGDAHHAAGELSRAREAWQQALDIYDDIQHPGAEKLRAKLAGTAS